MKWNKTNDDWPEFNPSAPNETGPSRDLAAGALPVAVFIANADNDDDNYNGR